jgi:transposase
MDGRELKAFERFKEQAQSYRARAHHLECELHVVGPALYRANQKISRLEKQVEAFASENAVLKQQVKELTAAAGGTEAGTPSFIKPPVRRRGKKPGRKAGHPAALRPMPEQIDLHQDVALPVDAGGCESCPHCRTGLVDLEDHERIVEDFIPAKKIATCYHTRSGFCPCCRRRVESRAAEQPPAANIPHGQLGLNALASAMVLRVVHRLPFRQVKQVLADVPELSVSPGAIARQVQRVAGWLEADREQLLLELRASPQVYADETGWRTHGRNGYLWVITSPTHTLFHVDKSRSGEVIRDLLGKAFGGTLVTDYFIAYFRMKCKKQKCLTHLLRDLVESAEESEAFKSSVFFRKCKRLIKEMLLLKGRWDTLGDECYFRRVRRLERRLDHLAQESYDEPNARRLGKRLRRYQKELTAFLWDKDLDGTNNAAERALRPAVVARKISGGNLSEQGADSWATVASLLRTAVQQGKNALDAMKCLLVSAWAAEKPTTTPPQA